MMPSVVLLWIGCGDLIESTVSPVKFLCIFFPARCEIAHTSPRRQLVLERVYQQHWSQEGNMAPQPKSARFVLAVGTAGIGLVLLMILFI